MHVQQNVHLSISQSLGVEGWQHLDAVLLAALAIEKPVLLVGNHGSAKTYIVEQIAHKLGMAFRHYNASLLNYDDLVGIPMPNSNADSLHFVTTPGAIWDAEYVFFDEISRCRPDLQNKLFPIIHEKRVVGMDLPRLRLRWAAMNPPSPDNPDIDIAASQYYLGSEPLDPALTDRFAFIIPVPDWNDLSREEQRQLLNPTERTSDALETLPQLIQECRHQIALVEATLKDWLADYLVCVMDLLHRSQLQQSARRARTFVETIIAIHAARIVLEGDDADLDISTEMGILYGLPNNATEVPPSMVQVRGIHKQAWEIATRLDDDRWRMVLEEPDTLKRILLARELDLDEEEIARLVTQAFIAIESEPRKVGLSVAIFLALHRHHVLTPAAWEPIIQHAASVLAPNSYSQQYNNNSNEMQRWQQIGQYVLRVRHSDNPTARQLLEVNYVLAGVESMWQHYDWYEALNQFQTDLDFFGLTHLEED